MANENIGGVSVIIGGDFSPLLVQFGAAQRAAEQAGANVASAFGAGAAAAPGLVDQFGRAIQSTVAPTAEMSAALRSAAASQGDLAGTTEIATAALTHQVSQIQATSGALRVLSGEGGLRAAERFVASIPGIGTALQGAFPLVGILALTELVSRAAEHFGAASAAAKEFADSMAKAEQEATRLGEAIRRDDLALFALQFGQTASLAKQAGDEIGGTTESVHRNAVAMAQWALAQAQAQVKIKEQALQFNAFGAPVNARSTAGDDPAITLARKQLQDAQEQVEADQKRAQLLSAQALQSSGNDTQAMYNKQTEAANTAARAQKELEEQGKQLSEAGLEWRNKQIEAEEQQIDWLQRWAERYYEANQRVNESNAETALHFEEYANKYAESRAKVEAADAKKLYEPRPELAQTPISVPTAQQLSGSAIGAASSFSRQGGTTSGQVQAQIAQQQQLLSLAQEVNAPLQERLAIQQQLLQLQIAAAAAQGKSDDAAKIASANVALRQTLTEWKSLGLGNAAQDVEQAFSKIPQALGGALASGITGGGGKHQNIGKEISQALSGIGRQLLGTVFTQAIEKLIATIVTQTVVQQLLATIGLSVQTPSIIANTIAIQLLTDSILLQTGLLGFADGTNSAPGGWAMVGERGPELMRVPRGSQIIPNHKIGGYANGLDYHSALARGNSGGDQNNHFHGPVNVHANNPEEFVRKMPRVLKSRYPAFSPLSR